MPQFALTLAVCYLLGAIPFSYLLGRLLKGIDIRQHGSGNVGATNLGRTVGWKWFPLALLLDLAKGALPVALLKYELLSLQVDGISTTEFAAAGGLAALLGHLFPIYLGFRGGKGVATGAGVIGVLLPWPTVVAVAVFVVTVVLFRYISLSSMLAALALVLARFVECGDAAFTREEWAPTLLALVGATFVLIRHRGNARRILAGTEPRVGRKATKTSEEFTS